MNPYKFFYNGTTYYIDGDKAFECAKQIPILQVASIVVPQFKRKGNNYTGACVLHSDKKLGNLQFNVKRNYYSCFSCGKGGDTLKLVQRFRNYSVNESIIFLYQNFPDFFDNNTINVESISSNAKRWSGLTYSEYAFLDIRTNVTNPITHSNINIRDLYVKNPSEHNLLLTEHAYLKQTYLEKIYNELINKPEINKEKLDKDFSEKVKYVTGLVDRGLAKV